MHDYIMVVYRDSVCYMYRNDDGRICYKLERTGKILHREGKPQKQKISEEDLKK